MPKKSKTRVRKSPIRKSKSRVRKSKSRVRKSKSRVRKTYKMNKNIGDASTNRVLILCQRKTGPISKEDSEDVSKQINPAIEKLASDIIQSPKESCKFEYMSPGVNGLEGKGDYPFTLALENNVYFPSDPSDLKDANIFFDNNHEKYKAVVFQTCPIMYMTHTIQLVASLLEDNGLLIFIAVNKEQNKLSMHEIDILQKGSVFDKFVTQLQIYFGKTEQPFIYRKK